MDDDLFGQSELGELFLDLNADPFGVDVNFEL